MDNFPSSREHYYDWYENLDERLVALKERLDDLKGASRGKVRSYGKALIELQQKSYDKWLFKKPLQVACSGGVDSMVLLCHIYTLGLTDVGVSHFHHRVRNESDEEYVLVEKLTKLLGYDFSGHHLEEPPERGFETWAREQRYTQLCMDAKKQSRRIIVTAHHRDDSCESILAHLIKGTQGLGGMKAYEERGEYAIARPFLSISKELIREYALVLAIPHGEDVTNEDITIERNYIRHVILPAMKTLNPQVNEAIYKLSMMAIDDEDYFSKEVDLFLNDYTIWADSHGEVPKGPLQALHPSLLSRVWYRLLTEVGVTKRVTYEHIQSLIRLSLGPSGKKFSLGNVQVTAKYDKMEIDVL